MGAVLEIPVTAEIARVGGIVCGQALSTLAETAMVFACAGHLGEFVPVATTNLETRLLSAARGDAIRCTARVVKGGRALLFAEAVLVSLPDEKEVARASATFFKP
ncbi:Phenylacetic acid degradation-related protein [Sagittula stellata E-37]|uniref:Phenylacetic acid degradation-related protein n=1 Tax=Sagittula stellata (strain ATCC 700073 / DSM 11524 / E-37) TaxID=388399 RepID=A3JZW6_SAGS3|nr:Phenylacetic acid degradation-related protein [Sagittula stellata E-37]